MTLRNGNCLEVLKELEDNSIDSIVTDPPYELGFMGKKWDNSGIAFNVQVWEQCLRVLKPGGHLLAFGGSRTWHRIAVAIEDAGFEVRDSIAWMYGSGFPKSLNISKAIDKAAGAEREVIGKHPAPAGRSNALTQERTDAAAGIFAGDNNSVDITAPATDEAKQWDGWGTALKPAFEPIVVARKPLIGTVAENVLTYGTGGINIDWSRISSDENFDNLQGRPIQKLATRRDGETDDEYRERVLESPQQQEALEKLKNLGRWPANVILDEYTAELLDEQSGISKSTTGKRQPNPKFERVAFGHYNAQPDKVSGHNDFGGASRFFYCAKASKRDRNEGLDEIEAKEIGAKGNGLGRTCATCGASVLGGCDCPDRTYVNPTSKNHHPTVKPTTLMRYLVKLVTPPNGLVLDPFMGSGSTGKAAILERFRFMGIELSEEYLEIAKARIEHAQSQVDGTFL